MRMSTADAAARVVGAALMPVLLLCLLSCLGPGSVWISPAFPCNCAPSITRIRASRNRKSHAASPNARRGDAASPRAGRGTDAGALRRPAQRRRPGDDGRRARPRHGRGRRPRPDDHRPDRRAPARPGRPRPAADRELRCGLRPHRRGDRTSARDHGLQHPRGPRRGHRRHGDGADPRGAAPPARGLAPDAERRLAGLEPDRAHGPPHRRQEPRHPRARPDRPRHRPPRPHLRPRHPLPQPPAAASRHRGRARGDLVGKPRPDAGAHRHPERERAAHALDLPPPQRPAAEADEAHRLHRQHRPRRGDRRERAHPHAPRGRARRRRPRRLRARPRHQPAPPRPAERAPAAPHGLGDDRGPARDGREGHHQHQDLRRRPPAPRPGRALDALCAQRFTAASALGPAGAVALFAPFRKMQHVPWVA